MNQALTVFSPIEGFKSRAVTLKARAERLVRGHPRETIGASVIGLIGFAAVAGVASSPDMPAAQAAPPAPPPLLLKQVAREQALQINQTIPVASGPNPAALPFVFKGNPAAKTQALQCLASAVYYEAGNQDADGERAVAQVVLNRVRHPAFPASVCGVVYEGSTRQTGCQFTFTCDGSLYRQPDADGWRRAYKVAEAALAGAVYAPVGYATHYHANYVLPVWAATLAKTAIVGDHLFYRWAGGWGQPAAFSKSYGGREPNAVALRNAALAAVHTSPTITQGGEVAELVAKIPGAEAIKLAPSMRGDKRVAIRFNIAGRKAAEDAVHEDYVKKFEASDNLKWSLSGAATAPNEQPLGKPAAPPAGGGAQP